MAQGTAIFAGIVMVIVGVFHALDGFIAIVEDDYYVVTDNYTYEFDITAWGWIHLVIGIILIAAGLSVFKGFLWARMVGIAAVALSAIANFFFIPYYPFASILIIAIDILVIWALCVYSRSDALAR
jgi:hypothetical protein